VEDLKTRIKVLMHEIEFTHLKKNWVERLIAADVEKEDAYQWVAEIGHVVDEYERSLRFLVDLLQTNDASSAAQELESWVAYTRDMTIWKLGDVMNQLQGRYEKYLPPALDDEDEPS
jgi:hypothetical protein